MADYYAALGVSRDASAQEIKGAFRRIARESHPDANPGDVEAEERFRRAAEAYEVLSDPQRRAAYDRGDMVDFGDLFSSFAGVDDLLQRFFGSGFGGGFGSRPRRARGADLARVVSVSLAEAVTGVEHEISYEASVVCAACEGSGSAPGAERVTCDRCGGGGSLRAARQTLLGTAVSIVECDRCSGRGTVVVDPCPECGGSGSQAGERSMTLEIPPGVEDGNRLRVTGGGHAGTAGDPAGDLYVEVRVEPDPRFERHGVDLVHRVSVGLAEAALGTALSIPRIDDDAPEIIDLPPGTQSGTVFRLPRLGMPRLGGRRRGDILVEVVVAVPTDLTTEQEAALRAYAEASDETPTAPKKRKRKK
jgi:molecular chaperone DnaJ